MAGGERSYWWLHLGFFTCGFHVAFLVTHLPGEVQLCGLSPLVSANSLAIIGLANVAGSLGVGWLGTRCRMKFLLFVDLPGARRGDAAVHDGAKDGADVLRFRARRWA